MSFADLARKASTFAINQSPTILTSMGVVGAITTAYLAGKASFQACDVIRQEEEIEYRGEADRRDAADVLKDRFNLTWRLYIPAGVMCIATVTCVIGANKIGSRRAAGLAAATTILERSFDEYKEKVVEKLGARKEEQVRDEIIADNVSDSYSDTIKMTGLIEGETCFDSYSRQYFLGSVEGIMAAVNAVNNAINHDGNATLADLYRALDMEVPDYAENVGWNHDRLIEVRTGATLAHGSKPVITMEFRNLPGPDYGRFH
jgi:hypothetical protein